jgi:spermidine/putrescine-binding protein
MNSKPISRREMLRLFGLAGGAVVLASCQKATPTASPASTSAPVATQVPATVAPTAKPVATAAKASPQWNLTDPKTVGLALRAEGAEVTISSWGFSGLPQTHFIPKFAEMTNSLYGVPVKLNWIGGVFDQALRELPVAGKTIADIGLDVVDKEEESFDAAMAVDWYEPMDMDVYKPLLPNVAKVEEPYLFRSTKENGGDVYGAVYQGYEWLQGVLRKDKLDVKNYVDWTDFARPELKDKMITYAFNDNRGLFVFAGYVNALIKQGKIKAELWSKEAWEAALTWWKDNKMDGQVHKWGDIGNDPIMRTMLQSGEAIAGCTWGVYTRELLGIDWNKKDDLLAPFYPKSGILADRETLSAVRGAKHPVAARILMNWMCSTEFNTAGWYKAEKETEAVNHWKVTESQFLVSYCGGIYKEMRDAIPAWAKNYHPADPGSLILKCNWPWYNQNAEWISKSYDRIVKGA